VDPEAIPIRDDGRTHVVRVVLGVEAPALTTRP